VHLRCRTCGAHFCLTEYQGQMDEQLDEELAHTRCDRL
jgi:hypothetical protein